MQGIFAQTGVAKKALSCRKTADYAGPCLCYCWGNSLWQLESQEENRQERLEEELASTKDQLMRLAAEFENFKKRMEREQSRLVKYAGENILRDLLSTVDNLDRALEQGDRTDEDVAGRLKGILEGVSLTKKSLLAALERFGVEPIASVGKPFNPDEQDALTMEASDTIPANHVVREFAKGFRYKDRILRHAQVVVSSGPQL